MIPFIGQDYQHRSKEVATNRLVNAYVETVKDENAKSHKIVIGTAGTKVFGDLGTFGQCRGLHTTANATNSPFGVYGSKLFEIMSDGTGEERADIGNQGSFVSMADNGYYLMIADGVNLWAYNFDTQVMQEVTPADFTAPTFVKYLKQRFVAINADPTRLTGDEQVPNSNKIYYSEVGPDGCLTWPNLNFFSSESTADANTGMAIAGNALWVFGTQSYEVYGLQADPNNPYTPIGGGASELGCSASFSVSTIGGQVFWLGSSRSGKNQVFMSNAYSPVPISNHAIEYQLSLIDDTSDAIGWTYQEEGHVFYVLTLVGGNKTFVYDVTENYWHERTTRRKLTNIQDRYAPAFSCFAYESVLLGFNNQEGGNSLVLTLDLEQYDDWDGRPIVRELQGPVLWDDLRTVFHKEFKLDMDVGHALQTGQGSEPKLMLSYSDDSGHTFSSERIIDLPLIGKYAGIVAWRQLGSSRKRVYKVTFSDPIRFIVLGARLNAGGSNAY
jgi:hypothetical protein